MLKPLLPLAALLSVSAAQAQENVPPVEVPPLTLEQQTHVRCALAFAVVAAAQSEGEEWVAGYPAMDVRGEEFFVRTMAKIMEDERFTRAVVNQLIQQESDPIREGGRDKVQDMMPPCLALLDASGI